jgi:hypothetical protein
VQKHQLVIDGNSGDEVQLSGFWTTAGSTVSNNGHTYAIHNANGAAAQVLVDTNVSTSHLYPAASPLISPRIAAGNGGFVLSLQGHGGRMEALAGAGDVNGDGLADLIISDPLGNTSGGSLAGRSYVVFGKASNSTLSDSYSPSCDLRLSCARMPYVVIV